MERIEAAGETLSAVAGDAAFLAKHVTALAQALQSGGLALQEQFQTLTLSHYLNDDERAIIETLVAWREVGEAQVALAAKLLDVAASVQQSSKQSESELSQRMAEAQRLQKGFEDVESAANAPTNKAGWRSFFGGGEPAPQTDDAASKARVDGMRTATNVSLEHLAEQLEAAQKRGQSFITESLNEVRRHSKAVGEKMVILKPSWKGSNARSIGAAVTAKATGAVSSGKKVSGLLKSISTVEGREKIKEEEAAREAALPKKVVKEEAPMTSPPVEKLGDGQWHIKGVYEHQVLKAGLRQLDEKWPTDGLLEFPRNKDGSATLFREKLVGDLLAGTIRLQSVPNNDVSAAQSDVKKLSLRQLLKLRVSHLEYKPSGVGADTVNAVGERQEAFLSTLDSILFQKLGEKASLGLKSNSESSPYVADIHRLGRDAVIFMATASSIPEPACWCWWLPDERRAFFNARSFESQVSFPDGGVLEITTDNCRPDRHDPSGKLRWFDWKISKTASESSLADTPPTRGNSVATTSFSSAAGADGNADGKTAPPAASVGGATAGMISATVLNNVRGSLRQTGGPGSPEKQGETPKQ